MRSPDRSLECGLLDLFSLRLSLKRLVTWPPVKSISAPASFLIHRKALPAQLWLNPLSLPGLERSPQTAAISTNPTLLYLVTGNLEQKMSPSHWKPFHCILNSQQGMRWSHHISLPASCPRYLTPLSLSLGRYSALCPYGDWNQA